jgi:hypothetical protein
MTPPKKESWIKKNIGFGAIVLIITTVIGWYITDQRKQDAQKITHDSIENRIPESIKTFVEWEDHMNEKPSDIENFQREQRLIVQGDIQINQQVKLDSQQMIIENQLKVIDSFFVFAKKKKVSDSITEIGKQKSRDKRTDDMETISASMLLILKKVNAIQDSID